MKALTMILMKARPGAGPRPRSDPMTILVDQQTATVGAHLAGYAAAAQERAGEVLRSCGVDEGALLVAVRSGENRLRCVVRVDALVDPIAAQMIAIRVVDVLRSLDEEVDVIDVDVVDAEGKLRRVTP